MADNSWAASWEGTYARMAQLKGRPQGRRLRKVLEATSVALADGHVIPQGQVPAMVPFTYAPTEAEREIVVSQLLRATHEVLRLLDL